MTAITGTIIDTGSGKSHLNCAREGKNEPRTRRHGGIWSFKQIGSDQEE
jgi:hypothetical protein